MCSFTEAKRLLQKHYGDELMIASAYIDKALKWPQIRSDDGKSLNAYAVFLTGCRNTIEDVEFMEEMDNPTNMKIVVSKLPYKIKEKWRNVAYEILEKRGHRARFADLVTFIDRQAKIAMDPLFGDLQDSCTSASGKNKEKEKPPNRSGMKGSTFATNMSVEKKKTDAAAKQATPFKAVSAFETPCIFCHKTHMFASCTKFKELTHKDRVDFLKMKGLCFGCLTQGHLSKTCKKRMVCNQCSQRHPDVLHVDEKSKESTTTSTKDDSISNEEISGTQKSAAQEIVGYTGAGEVDCLFSIVPVKVRSRKGGKSIETYAFMDPGSTATFCTEELRKKLNIKGKSTQILLSTLSQDKLGGQKLMNSCMLSDLEVCGLENTEYIQFPKVFTHNNIPVQRENIPRQQHLQKWPYLSEVHLPYIDANVELLIGANNSKAMEPWHVINSQDDGPYAIKTVLGWMVCGPVNSENKDMENTPHYSVNRVSVIEIEQLLIQQYNTDFPERRYEDKEEMSQEDKQFMLAVQRTTKYEDGHYCVGLPLKCDTVEMPNNRCMAEQRAAGIKRKLQKNEVFLEDYKGFMHSLFAKGYAVEVPQEQLDRKDNKVWYVPHHGVYHPKKKKIRVVFDCTATYQEVSLNGALLQGPDLTNSLIGVLVRFRKEPIAMMADIESMFYQVRVPETDADLLRFLWWPDGNLQAPLKEYRMAVHLFGATSSPSVACYALRRTAEDRKDTAAPEVVKTVQCNFYMDDCLTSVSSEEKAVALVKNLRDLCAEGGFNLTKWVSNSRKVLSSIPEEHRASELKDLDLTHDALPIERALGVQWCTDDDSFTYKIQLQDKPKTRRGILSVVNSIYDPLGFLAPVVLPAKLLLRDLCKEKLGWDEEISGWKVDQWCKWLEELTHLSDFSIHRCVKPLDFGQISEARLHHFSDASENAYGVVSYLVSVNHQGRIHCAFVFGKARVGPLKQITIPRLELTAAVIAVKVDKMLREEMQIPLQPSLFWTDSTTVLRYIHNETAHFKTFVANRITLIREATKPQQWRYIRTSENPADQATRGMKAKSLIQGETWIKGPQFLLQPESEWPERLDTVTQSLQNDPEVKNITVNIISTEEKSDPVNKLLQHYSSWYRLKRAVAWLLRVKRTLIHLKEKRKELQHSIRQTETDPDKQEVFVQKSMDNYRSVMEKKTLTLDELMDAETKIIRHSQNQWFHEEVKALQNKLPVKRNSQLYKLDPVLHEDILRVGGRLSSSAMPHDAKHPAILSKNSRVATLILQHVHRKIGHCGRNYMMSQLRQKFWIPQVTSAIRRLISECTVCRRLRGQVEKDGKSPEGSPFARQATFH